MKEALYIHGFWLIAGMTYSGAAKIFRRFVSFREAWENGNFAEFERAGLGKILAENIILEREKINLKQEAEKLWELDLVLVDKLSEEYPTLLKEIHCAPFLLYRKGAKLELSGNCLAIVGTRKASIAGQELAYEIAKSFSELGGTVISGLAYGIDAAAHRGAVAAGRPTIAVLGCGPDRVYPHGNHHLAEQILAGNGSIISEYPPGKEAFKFNFIERNRIISGLCKASLIVEAAEKSGALITAHYALEQNRHIFAVGGDFGKQQSRGTNRLIKNGEAEMLLSVDEILTYYGLLKNSQNLTLIQNDILQLLDKQALTFETIQQKIGTAEQDLLPEITALEIEHLIRRNFAYEYELSR
jgi:DNA processing protein